jgi:glutamate-1-semialdehyde 2,1-aminomutase
MSYTGSYWLSAVPFAAGIACIEKMKRIGINETLNKKGQLLKDGLTKTAEKHGFDLRVTGALALPYLRLADDDSLIIHQSWIAECVKRGVFFTNHHNHFINAAMTEQDIKETIEVADEAFEIIKKTR